MEQGRFLLVFGRTALTQAAELTLTAAFVTGMGRCS
jgi:hypothetical protein